MSPAPNPADVVEQHVQAFLALARSHPELGGDVFEGKVVNPPERYASVWANNGVRQIERQDHRQLQITTRFTVHSVGTSLERARWVAGRIMLQVLDVRPVIDGRACWPIRLGASLPADLDQDIKPELYFGVDEFTLTSTPRRSTHG